MESYEQKYKEALGWMKSLYGGLHGKTKEEAEKYFPELAESEDERIRKEIISHLQHEYVVKRYVSDVEYDRWIAWLEKQGEEDSSIQQAYKQGYIEGQRIERKCWLEKQGQQKYIPKYKIGDYVKNTNYKGEPIYEIIYMDKECYICEYRGKKEMGDKTVMHFSFDNPYLRLVQKPVDKAEPKFHEGEWIIDGQGIVRQIERVIENVTNHTFGYDLVGGDYFNEEYDVRLWTIQDAKDGDVLASGHLVFIFKVIHGVWLNCHCSAHNDGSFIADSYDLMTNKYFSEVHPATKEQRDFLFAKMKEEGFEWDKTKKELRKIEQKSKWTDEDEERREKGIPASHQRHGYRDTDGRAEEVVGHLR